MVGFRTGTLPSLFKLRAQAEAQAADLPSLMTQAEKVVASAIHGEHARRKAGPGEKFWQFREYTGADRPQDIDWRQSGKTERIYVRQKEWQTTQNAIFWCARSAGMNFSSGPGLMKKSETAAILTMALALLLTRGGEQAGIFGQSRAGRSEASLQRIGEYLLDKTAPDEMLPDPLAHRLPRHCSFIQTGDFLEPLDTITENFKQLYGQADNGFVIQILDPAEIELPYAGRAVFEMPGGGLREPVDNVESVRGTYRKRITRHLGEIQEICRRQHWGYILHRTDESLKDTLSLIWRALSHTAPAGGPL